MMKRATIVTLCLILCIFAGISSASGVTLLGPNQYVRTSGSPDVYNDSFNAIAGEGMLIVRNGAINGSDRVTDAISSATIYVNGVQIFGPNDFNQNVYLLQAPVNLSENNSITVELASNPGSYLTIEITQEGDQPSVSLNADPEIIQTGETSMLTWVSTNSDSCVIDNGIGNVALNGSISVSPTETTTYTITATGPSGTVTASVTVTVTQPSLTVSIIANPENIQPGQSSTLTWTSENSDSCVIDNGIGNVPLNGSMSVSPTETTTYTITATGPSGTITDSATITVMYPPASVSIIANPENIQPGQSSTLTWTSENSDSCVIDNGIGNVPLNGSMSVSPTETTTYTITATGPSGTITASVTITVMYPPASVSIIADPENIQVGQSSTLTWTSENSDSCIIDNGIGSVPLNGSISVSPTETTTYTITATGPSGTVTASVTVTLTDSQPIVFIDARPNTIQSGESAFLNWFSSNADECTIEPGIGTVDPNGTIMVSPIETTTYTITAIGPGGTASAQITVTVIQTTPVVTFNADPETINLGQSSTLSWTTLNADTVYIDHGIGNVALNGSITVSPTETTTYTITATGPQGTATDSVIVNVIQSSPTVTISADPDSIQLTESTTLTWTSTDASSCTIDNGVGNVPVNGSITLSPTETTTYTITATGSGGVAMETVTVYVIPIGISIDSPSNGELITRPDVMVQGAIINPLGREVRVKINETAALVYGNQFVANHVPLAEGENTIQITAMTAEGDIASMSVLINSSTASDYIRLTAISDSGISPLETKLVIDGPFNFSSSVIYYNGPGTLENLEADIREHKIRITGEGVHFITVEAIDDANNTQTDTVTIEIMSLTEVDSSIRAVWDGMKIKLMAGDNDGALEYFNPFSSGEYEEIFAILNDDLPDIVSGMEDIEYIYIKENLAKYRIKKNQIINGETHLITYYIYFVRDFFGNWYIDSF